MKVHLRWCPLATGPNSTRPKVDVYEFKRFKPEEQCLKCQKLYRRLFTHVSYLYARYWDKYHNNWSIKRFRNGDTISWSAEKDNKYSKEKYIDCHIKAPTWRDLYDLMKNNLDKELPKDRFRPACVRKFFFYFTDFYGRIWDVRMEINSETGYQEWSATPPLELMKKIGRGRIYFRVKSDTGKMDLLQKINSLPKYLGQSKIK